MNRSEPGYGVQRRRIKDAKRESDILARWNPPRLSLKLHRIFARFGHRLHQRHPQFGHVHRIAEVRVSPGVQRLLLHRAPRALTGRGGAHFRIHGADKNRRLRECG